MNKIFEDIMNFIFPPRCPVCDSYVETYGGWCEECLLSAVKVERVPLAPEMLKIIDAAWALGSYQGTLGRLIRRLKFQCDRSALPKLHTFLQAAERKFPDELSETDVITAVPLYKAREKERGFNQTEKIFSVCFEIEKVLERVRETIPQYELTAEERKENLKGAFSLEEGTEVKGKNILLVDDIMTTGTTFFECAKALKNAGAEKIYVLALASDR